MKHFESDHKNAHTRQKPPDGISYTGEKPIKIKATYAYIPQLKSNQLSTSVEIKSMCNDQDVGSGQD